MAVFGESYSKFQSRQLSVGTVIDLQYSIINPRWAEINIVQHQSVINGVKAFTKIEDDFATFDVICNLWKNGDPQATFETILRYNHDIVYFMPHADEGFYIDKVDSETPAEFYISKMVPFYVNNEPPMLQDKLLITFESLVAVNPASIITNFFTMDLDGGVDPIITLQGTGTVKVNWGDESANTYSLTGSNQDITHHYASGGTYTVKIYDSDRITKFRSSTDNNYSFDLKELKKFNSALFYFRIEGNNIITGDLSNLSGLSDLYLIQIYGNNTVTGNLSGLSGLNNLTYFRLSGNNTTTGNLSSLSELIALNWFYVKGDNTISDYITVNWLQTGFNYFHFEPTSGSGLSSVEIDGILIDMDADITWTGSDKTLWIAGNNAARTSASDAAVLSLQAKGVTVTTS